MSKEAKHSNMTSSFLTCVVSILKKVHGEELPWIMINALNVNKHQCFKINCCTWQMWQRQRNILPTDMVCSPKANKKQIYESILPSSFTEEESASDDLSCHVWRGDSVLAGTLYAIPLQILNKQLWVSDWPEFSFMIVYEYTWKLTK